eukprot:gene7092-9677_t
MSNLSDLAIDLFNDAKSVKDSQKKLFYLEQIKEICMHRDKSVLKEILQPLMDFMVEKSVQVRKFLVRFCSEAVYNDQTLSFPYFLNIINFFLADANDSLVVNVIKEFQKHYERIILLISRSSKSILLDPKVQWTTFRTITNKLNDYIVSTRTDFLKISSLKLVETEMLFGLPLPPVTSDPRLARSMKKDSSASIAKNAEDIPLHHQFINRNELQQEAEDNFSKMLLWASKGGAQNNPFSATLMSELGQTIANVASLRPKNAGNAANAISVMIQGKGNMSSQMTGIERENLARATNRLLRAATAFTGQSKEVIQKLRDAVQSLESFGLGDSSIPQSSGVKRGREEKTTNANAAGDAEVVEEEDEETVARRASAKAAIDAAESSINAVKANQMQKDISSFLDSVGDVTGDTAKADCSSASDILSYHNLIFGGESIELSTDLGVALLQQFNELGAMKMSSVRTAQDSKSVLQQTLIPVEPKEYGELAIFSVRKLLNNFYFLNPLDVKGFNSYTLMAIRMIVSLSFDDMITTKQLMKIAIISNVPNIGMISKIQDTVPLEISLPKSLWIFLTFCLTKKVDPNSSKTNTSSHNSNKKMNVSEAWEITNKLDMLINLFQALYSRFMSINDHIVKEEDNMIVINDENSENIQYKAILTGLYDTSCLVCISRMLQIVSLKSHLQSFLMKLPRIPNNCLELLKLLVINGTKSTAIVPQANKRDHSQAFKNRGTKLESLLLLGQLALFEKDDNSNKTAVHHLLWNSISEDFEIRSKVVQIIANDIFRNAEWSIPIIKLFALQCASIAMGNEMFEKWLIKNDNNDSSDLPLGEHENKMEVVEDSQDGADGQDVNKDVQNNHDLLICPIFHSYKLLKSGENVLPGSYPSRPTDDTKVEAFTKRMFHLLNQVVMVDANLVGYYMDIYAISSTSAPKSASIGLTESNEGVGVGTVTGIADTNKSETKTNNNGAIVTTASKDGWNFLKFIEDELKVILPYLQQHSSIENLFKILSNGGNKLSQPLLEMSLSLMLHDHSYTPSTSLIKTIEEFIFKQYKTVNNENYSHELSLVNQLTDQDFKLIITLIGGWSTIDVVTNLPRIVRLFSENVEQIKIIFNRIVRARPISPLTKTTLLVALHRIDFEKAGLKPKAVLDAIAVCLNNKADYSSDVIREALKALLTDDPPPLALMRTAILSSQSNTEVK